MAPKLAALREALELSQGQIAKALGVPNRASISGYERGEREPPLPTLLAYAKLAKLSTDVLIDDEWTVEQVSHFTKHQTLKPFVK